MERMIDDFPHNAWERTAFDICKPHPLAVRTSLLAGIDLAVIDLKLEFEVRKCVMDQSLK